MAISFTHSKRLASSELLDSVVKILQENVTLFIYVARVFENANKNTPEHKKRAGLLIRTQVIAIPTQVNIEIRKELASLILQIYDHANFKDIRSGILENMIYYFGPFNISIDIRRRFVEPMVWNDNQLIGGTRRCDIVFYESDNKPIEFVECKSNIANVIPWDRKFDDEKYVNTAERSKVLYLTEVYNYLKSNYCEPSILFACFNVNYERQLQNVRDNWGFDFIGFLNPVDLVQSVLKRTAG